MITLSQSLGGEISLAKKPERIISLVPSITENLILFGKIPIARTSFCIKPKEQVKNIPVVGGTKTPRISKIISLKPDLVIANQEENIKEHIEEIQNAGIPVWVTFPKKVSDLIPMMKELGSLCEQESQSASWIKRIQAVVHQTPTTQMLPKVMTLIWKNPWMAAGVDTYTSDLIHVAGGSNPVQGRYPAVEFEQILDLQPDLLLLPTEPYEFDQDDVREWKILFKQAGLSTEVFLFSGEDLLWSGTRCIQAFEALREICQRFGKTDKMAGS